MKCVASINIYLFTFKGKVSESQGELKYGQNEI